MASAEITCDALVVELRIAGFKPLALHQTVVVAERPIAGHPGWYRVLHFTAGLRDWQGVLRLKRPRSWALTEWEYDPVPLSERTCLVDIEQVSLWVGGAVSTPLDEIEVAALSAKLEPSKRVA